LSTTTTGPALTRPLYDAAHLPIDSLCGDLYLDRNQRSRSMLDLVYLCTGLGFFALLALYARATDRL
jgi:hypothetical protein